MNIKARIEAEVSQRSIEDSKEDVESGLEDTSIGLVPDRESLSSLRESIKGIMTSTFDIANIPQKFINDLTSIPNNIMSGFKDKIGLGMDTDELKKQTKLLKKIAEHIGAVEENTDDDDDEEGGGGNGTLGKMGGLYALKNLISGGMATGGGTAAGGSALIGGGLAAGGTLGGIGLGKLTQTDLQRRAKSGSATEVATPDVRSRSMKPGRDIGMASDKIGGYLESIKDFTMTGFGWIMTKGKEIYESIEKKLKTLEENTRAFLEDPAGSIKEFLGISGDFSLVDETKQLLGLNEDFNLVQAVKNLFTLDTAIDLGSWVWTKTKAAFTFTYDKLENFGKWIFSKLDPGEDGIFNFEDDQLSGFGDWIFSNLNNEEDGVFDFTNENLSSFGDWLFGKIDSAIPSFNIDIVGAIKNKVPSWAESFVSGESTTNDGSVDMGKSITRDLGGGTDITDGVITNKGEVIKTAPEDYLFATKNPESLAQGGGDGGMNSARIESKLNQVVQELRSQNNTNTETSIDVSVEAGQFSSLLEEWGEQLLTEYEQEKERRNTSAAGI